MMNYAEGVTVQAMGIIYTCVNCMQYGGFTRKVHANKI